MDINPKRSKTGTGTNARFDQMIEKMSVVHSQGRSTRNASSAAKGRLDRSLSPKKKDAYSLPPTDQLKRGLSFIKMDNKSSSPSSYFDEDGPSSDGVEANIEKFIVLIIHV